MHDAIIIKGARTNNLKNVSLTIPKYKLVVLTGLSGSGKSSLVFDTLQKECMRQYMESMGLVTDFLSKPKVDSIVGLSPSISVDQHLTNKSPRSTVGTVTEVYTYIRVLFARLGHRPCPACGKDIGPSFSVSGNETLEEEIESGDEQGASFAASYPCPHCGKLLPELSMANFSFNKPAGACPSCTGLGVVQKANIDKLVDPNRSVADEGVIVWDNKIELKHFSGVLQLAGKHYGFEFDLNKPIKKFNSVERDLLLYGVESCQFGRHFPDIAPPKMAREGRFEGVVTNLKRRYAERINDMDYRQRMEKMFVQQLCPVCAGTRLKEESRKVAVLGKTIIELSNMPLEKLYDWIVNLPERISPEELIISKPIIDDLRERAGRLVDVGIGYLDMERSAPSLSAGEAQRLRLASLLGSGLTNVLYVLDEPTIGLHARDTKKLISVLKRLRDLGNTVVVVEHDLEMIKAADYIVDVGPGAGKDGGEIVASGGIANIMQSEKSETGKHLAGKVKLPIIKYNPSKAAEALVIYGATVHNLKNITVRIPLKTLVAITGVSGSGKSSLMFDILDVAARNHFNGSAEIPGEHEKIEGFEYIDKIITIDQTPIGRIPRSNAATYTDTFTPIRQLFASLPAAKQMRLEAKHFSFNVSGGRCERCEGAGVLNIPMHFLPDVQVRCPVCHGKRFKPDILAVKFKGCSISDILVMTIRESLQVFADAPLIYTRLKLMDDVGLGYLQLGQPATTLSGGEAQRVKLAKELGRRGSSHTLYLLDEPTTGLHPSDTHRLIELLQRLVRAGNSVVIVEHNIDVIRSAGWIIDLGPEGGEAGGYVIAEGTPEDIAGAGQSHTGKCLQEVMAETAKIG
jgi:excinuclease ABC subunit A